MLALDDLISFLKKGGEIALYDGTNSTKERRNVVKTNLKINFPNAELIWIESICDDEDVIERNIKLTKLNNPDYINIPSEQATSDFKARIEKYKTTYHSVDEQEDLSFVKIIDIGRKFIIHNVYGYLQSKIISYLMNLHIYPRPIYFSRHGET